MEVMIPSSAGRDFNLDSASTTPYLSASSSPQRTAANFFYSAPTSPTRISAFYRATDHHLSSPSAVPFNWESKPGTPKISTAASSNYGDADQDLDDVDVDFAFDFSGHLDRHSLPADELFHGGKIKPLKPPPPFHYDVHPPPRSPRKIVQQAFSPRQHRPRDIDPFAAAMEQARKESSTDRRGRERNKNSNPQSQSSSKSRERNKGSSRSLSPFRVSDLLFDHPDSIEEDESKNASASTTASASNIFSSSFWYKKWKIKDLLLFRSASESRAKDKGEQLKKYSQLKKTRSDDVKNSSFRSTESVGSVSSRRKSGPPISAHELHYTMNRALSEEMRRRTSLPYKQGLLGCLGFNPTPPEMSKGLGTASSSSLPRGGASASASGSAG